MKIDAVDIDKQALYIFGNNLTLLVQELYSF